MNRLASRFATGIENHHRLIGCLGVSGWLLLQAQLRSPRAAELSGHRLLARASKFPLYYRPGDSDLEAFLQIFTHGEYDGIGVKDSAGLILDCGANVGYSTAWFATRFPDATIIAVEPDAANFALLQRNLAPFGPRVSAVNGAVWSNECGLVFDRSAYRDGLSWSVRVREAVPGEHAEIRAYDIPSLLRMAEADRVVLLKMDIERAEVSVFSDSSRDWIPSCDAIAIELHDDECERVFLRAIAGQGFRVRKARELTICERQ